MKSLLVTLSLLALVGTGSYVFAHGMGMGYGWYGNGEGHYGMMGYRGPTNGRFANYGYGMMGGCDNGPMDDVKVKVENDKDGVTVKMTSKDKQTVKFLQQHAEWMNKYHNDRE